MPKFENEVTVVYYVPEKLRARLKEPWGKLIRGSFSETTDRMKKLIERKRPPMLISVGDVVSRNLHSHQIIPVLAITDNKCMRKKTEPIIYSGKTVLYVRNPPGTITAEAIAAVRRALENNIETQVVVDGEEDILTLAAVLYAPEKSLVVYGQPDEGIVVVEVSLDKKAEAEAFLKVMKPVRKAK